MGQPGARQADDGLRGRVWRQVHDRGDGGEHQRRKAQGGAGFEGGGALISFENDRLTLSDSLSPETMPQWDSLADVRLMMGCEEECGVKFTIEETVESTSVEKLKAVLVVS